MTRRACRKERYSVKDRQTPALLNRNVCEDKENIRCLLSWVFYCHPAVVMGRDPTKTGGWKPSLAPLGPPGTGKMRNSVLLSALFKPFLCP